MEMVAKKLGRPKKNGSTLEIVSLRIHPDLRDKLDGYCDEIRDAVTTGIGRNVNRSTVVSDILEWFFQQRVPPRAFITKRKTKKS